MNLIGCLFFVASCVQSLTFAPFVGDVAVQVNSQHLLMMKEPTGLPLVIVAEGPVKSTDPPKTATNANEPFSLLNYTPHQETGGFVMRACRTYAPPNK